ncbi:MAG TPA: pyridoxamine 5'-phosphate oxidase [Porticoccaceae bacterium]|nr:pyridoxamine 5'-phosphate oxidase [Porticoccaceae bacterium]HCO58640.1 pyridoxamine 5'-phosphate oxidase [Porticoccaceae bacterium]
MASMYESLTNEHIEFIKRQHIFFVGTAGKEGYINVSPKGMDSFRVLNPSRIVWLNLTGSGNESAAHVLENGRMTIMFCSFDEEPLIMRLYGTARAVHPRDPDWEEMLELFPGFVGTRQFFELQIELVQTSCGYAVPYYQLVDERPTLEDWAKKKGRKGVEQYWKDNNIKSLNNKDTGIFEV